MTVQIWDIDGGFLGRLALHSEISAELSLSEAGAFTARAPYATWGQLMTYIPEFQQVECCRVSGETMIRGIWLTRDDGNACPGEMTIDGSDLMEELRRPCLPPDFYINDYPAVNALEWLLRQSGAGWELGDTSTAVDDVVSANLGQQSYLEAILHIASLSGNYLRHNGIDRVLDVFAEPYEVVAYIRALEPSDDLLPVNTGRIAAPPALTADTGEVLEAVYAIGGGLIDADGNESSLELTGTEELPAGFRFGSLRGQVAVFNENVRHGLIRQIEYPSIEPLSNRTVSVRGLVEASSFSSVTCEALRRPNDGFWTGGVLEVADAEYPIAMSSGPSVSGSWGQTFPVGTKFGVKRSFEYDRAEEDRARQDLANAACGHLRSRANPTQVLSVSVVDLQQRVLPGDKVHVEWVAATEQQDPMSDEMIRHRLTNFYGEMIVASVKVVAREIDIVELDLVRNLELLPTRSGVREMRALTAGAKRHANNRIMGHVGDTAPMLTWPGMIWIDTTE